MNETKEDQRNEQDRPANNGKFGFPKINEWEIEKDFEHIETVAEERFEEF